jgi:lysophospholipase L1-like esterase
MKLAEVVLTSDAGPAEGAPSVLVVVPPPFGPQDAWDVNESPQAESESRRLSRAYVEAAAAYAEWEGLVIPLLDLRDHVTSSPVDGIHFEAADHRAIGLAVAARMREMPGL